MMPIYESPNSKPLLRKRIRLPAVVYSKPGLRALVTIATHDRNHAFNDRIFAGECLDHLRSQATQQSVAVLVYCFMPDHVHLLLRVDGEIGIVDFIRTFKSITTRRRWKYGSTGRVWQRTFHDHLLRDAEDESEYLKYVLTNPVRAGLVDEWHQYPFAGSFEYDLADGLL